MKTKNIKRNVVRKGVIVLLLPLTLTLSQSFKATLPDEEWKAPATAKDKKNPIAPDETSIAAGKKVYEKECLDCHGRKGRGDGPKAASLDKTVTDLSAGKTQDQTDGELFWKISEGRKPMPSAKKTLSEDQRWQVINYIRTLKHK